MKYRLLHSLEEGLPPPIPLLAEALCSAEPEIHGLAYANLARLAGDGLPCQLSQDLVRRYLSFCLSCNPLDAWAASRLEACTLIIEWLGRAEASSSLHPWLSWLSEMYEASLEGQRASLCSALETRVLEPLLLDATPHLDPGQAARILDKMATGHPLLAEGLRRVGRFLRMPTGHQSLPVPP